MSKHYVFPMVFFFLVANSLFSPDIALAANGGSFDLAITAIEPDPIDLRVGQETSFVVTYQNVGDQAVDDSVEFDLFLRVSNQELDQTVGTCSQPMRDLVSGLEAGEIATYDFGAECKIIFRSEEQHLVQAVFVNSETEEADAFPETYLPLAGETKGSNSNNGYQRYVTVSPYESNLPDELGRLFAGLGMFFAVMAIMAVGTEVIIDSIKVFFWYEEQDHIPGSVGADGKVDPWSIGNIGCQCRFAEAV